MDNVTLEAILAIVLIVLFLGVCRWQSAKKLSKSEVDHYIGILEKELPQEMEGRAGFIARLRAWCEDDDGKPVYMLELMHFYKQLKSFPGGLTTGTPEEANAHYEKVAIPILLKSGGNPMIYGSTTSIRDGEKQESNLMVSASEHETWDRVIVVRYPGRRSFLRLMANPEYLKVLPYKLSSVEVVLTPTSGKLIMPDVRWIAGGAFLAIFLAFGWILAT